MTSVRHVGMVSGEIVAAADVMRQQPPRLTHAVAVFKVGIQVVDTAGSGQMGQRTALPKQSRWPPSACRVSERFWMKNVE
jgi:hypothetical protein